MASPTDGHRLYVVVCNERDKMKRKWDGGVKEFFEIIEKLMEEKEALMMVIREKDKNLEKEKELK